MAANNNNVDPQKPKSFEEGWAVMQEAVRRVVNIAEGLHNEPPITSEDYMIYYTVVYDLCVPGPFMAKQSQELRDRYRKVFEDYVTQKVLPSLQEKEDHVVLLQELQRRWSNHKTIVWWLMRFFYYLDRLPKNSPCLEQIGHLSFYDLVFGEMNGQIIDASMSLIEKEREGERIDRDLVRSVSAIYAEIGTKSTKNYVADFEAAMLKGSAEFYSRKASNWVESETHDEYLAKASDCLKHERDTVSFYLPTGRRSELLEVVERELLNVHSMELQQKEG